MATEDSIEEILSLSHVKKCVRDGDEFHVWIDEQEITIKTSTGGDGSYHAVPSHQIQIPGQDSPYLVLRSSLKSPEEAVLEVVFTLTTIGYKPEHAPDCWIPLDDF